MDEKRTQVLDAKDRAPGYLGAQVLYHNGITLLQAICGESFIILQSCGLATSAGLFGQS